MHLLRVHLHTLEFAENISGLHFNTETVWYFQLFWTQQY